MKKAYMWSDSGTKSYFYQLNNFDAEYVKEVMSRDSWRLFANSHDIKEVQIFILKKEFDSSDDANEYASNNDIQLLTP